eukprot:1183298-Pyramimonas_sp.AAC.1
MPDSLAGTRVQVPDTRVEPRHIEEYCPEPLQGQESQLKTDCRAAQHNVRPPSTRKKWRAKGKQRRARRKSLRLRLHREQVAFAAAQKARNPQGSRIAD